MSSLTSPAIRQFPCRVACCLRDKSSLKSKWQNSCRQSITTSRSTLLRTGVTGGALLIMAPRGTAKESLAPDERHQVAMQTLDDSELAVAQYPIFTYNSLGGGGLAHTQQLPDGRLQVEFDPKHLYIPDVYWRTAKFLSVPMAPPFRIHIVPKRLQGTIDRKSGQTELEFDADFMFTAGPLYKPPALQVVTHLTTEHASGNIRSAQGKRLDDQGFTRLVGFATVPKTGSAPLDKFLGLPNEAYAAMSSKFLFHDPEKLTTL